MLFPDPFSPTMQKTSPLSNRETQIAEGPEITVKGTPSQSNKLLKTVAGLCIDGVILRDALEFNGIHGQLQFNFIENVLAAVANQPLQTTMPGGKAVVWDL